MIILIKLEIYLYENVHGIIIFCRISNYANIYWSIFITVLTNEISERFVQYK